MKSKLAKPCVWILLLTPILFSLTACQSRPDKQFQGQMISDDARALYAPLAGGHEMLVGELGLDQAEPFSFRLREDRAKILERFEAGEDYWTDGVASFFRVQDEGKTRWLYLNPRFLRLEDPMEPRGWASDCVVNEEGQVSIYRAIALGNNWFSRPIHREILRYDFELEADQIRFLGVQRLTDTSTDKALPLPFPKQNRLAYVDTTLAGQMHLALLDLNTGESTWLVPERQHQSTNPAMTPAGDLIFAANPDGYFRLFEYDFESQKPQTYNQPYPKPDAGAFVLTNTYHNGRFQPKIARIPQQLTLAQACSLAAAGNPDVNRLRALYVAALFEAGEARLRHYPELTTLFSYTSTVGVFLNKPTLTAGDFLAEHVARGIFGVAQPLFDFRRNEALHRAGLWRVKHSKALIEDELNEQISNAATLYLEAQHVQRLIDVDTALLEVATRRYHFYAEQERLHDSRREQTLAAANIIAGLESERRTHRNHYVYLLDELRRVCGLSEDAPLTLADENWFFEHYQPPQFERLREIALLNHPRLDVVRSKLPELFNTYLAGPDIRPTGFYSDRYGQSRRHFTDALDDYINHSFSVNYPVMTVKARRLHEKQWRATLESFEIARQHQRRRILTSLREAHMDFQAAQEDWWAKQANAAYRSESLRVQRVYHTYGLPNAEGTLNPLSQNETEFEFLMAHRTRLGTYRDMALRYVRLWRELGLAPRIPSELPALLASAQRQNQASLWLWKTPDATKSLASVKTFVDHARSWGITRTYAYIGARGEYLKGQAGTEFERFLIEAAAAGIEIWALIGEPSWLYENGMEEVQLVHQAVDAFNQGRLIGEPRIAGIKMDVEPHAKPIWDESEDYRREINQIYLQLVQSMRDRSTLPLWVDCPPKYFTTDGGELARQLSERVDGITVMAYDHRLEHIGRLARRTLERSTVALEIGIELNPTAPAEVTLAGKPKDDIHTWIHDSRKHFREYPIFHGFAYHDYLAIKLKEGQDQ